MILLIGDGGKSYLCDKLLKHRLTFGYIARLNYIQVVFVHFCYCFYWYTRIYDELYELLQYQAHNCHNTQIKTEYF